MGTGNVKDIMNLYVDDYGASSGGDKKEVGVYSWEDTKFIDFFQFGRKQVESCANRLVCDGRLSAKFPVKTFPQLRKRNTSLIGLSIIVDARGRREWTRKKLKCPI